jgi:hypothetical protein
MEFGDIPYLAHGGETYAWFSEKHSRGRFNRNSCDRRISYGTKCASKERGPRAWRICRWLRLGSGREAP